MRRYALRDDQWDRIKDILPGREGHVGGTAADNRLFVEAVLFRFRAGVPWRDLPERFGDRKIVYQRFNRWAKSGVFERVFRLLASDHDNEYMMIDATIVRAHQHSAGAKKRRRASHRPIPRRTDHQDLRARRRPRQSCRGDAQPGPGSRSDLRSTAHRSRRSRRLDRRQGLRRRRLHRRPQRSSDRPGHPIHGDALLFRLFPTPCLLPGGGFGFRLQLGFGLAYLLEPPLAHRACDAHTETPAAALRDAPPKTTASTTRLRRSSESAIPAASFPRRESSIRTQPIRAFLTRFSPLGYRSSGTQLTADRNRARIFASCAPRGSPTIRAPFGWTSELQSCPILGFAASAARAWTGTPSWARWR